MIQLCLAGKRFGPKLLFENCDWLITPRDRVGLVGANGTGKTTLLKTLARVEPLDYGDISFAKGVTAGYLPQDGLSLSGRTVMAECMSVFDDLLSMEQEMETLMEKMGELDPAGPEYAAVADRFNDIDTEFQHRDGYALEAQVGMVLGGLGFPPSDWNRYTEEFSGGWQMRLALAKLLLEKPNLLLLDEPTNHLDLEARNWLEEYLHDYPHACVLISHDRFFLDVTVNKIVEIWNQRVHFYTGNYEKYLKEKGERRAQIEAVFQNQRDRIEQLEIFISRFRYTATKAKQVQSRIKELEKIDRIVIPKEEKAIHFKFPQPKPSGRHVVEFDRVSKSYDTKHVFANASFTIERGDRVALVGINGAGKSTLIKLLAGAEPITGGEIKLGHNVEADYFAQDQYKELNPESRLLDDLTQSAPSSMSTQTELRGLLGCFLFSEDDVFKRIKVLSGGERNRYALAKMLLHPSNFLLLDEPTNHLDLRAKDVLLESLEKYTGTIVFVSHDRYFIDKLATRVFEIGGGEVNIFPGNYEDYLWRKSGKELDLSLPGMPDLIGERNSSRPKKQDAVETAPPAEPPRASKTKKVNPLRLRQLKDRCREIEEDVAKRETQIEGYGQELAHFKSAEESVRLTNLIERGREEMSELMREWEESSKLVEESSQEAEAAD